MASPQTNFQPEDESRAVYAAPSIHAARAPLAIAASLGVIAAGAAFIAYAMSLAPSAGAPAPVIETVGPIAPDASPAAKPEIVADASSNGAVIAGPPEEAQASNAENVDAAENNFAPRLKPVASTGEIIPPTLKPGAAETNVPHARGVVSFATPFAADESDRPPSFFFADDVDPRRAPRPSLAQLFERDLPNARHEMRVSLAKGETFVDALRRAGVDARDRNEAAYAFGKLYNMRTLRPGQDFRLTLAEPNETLFQRVSDNGAPPVKLVALEFRPDAETRIALSRGPDGFEAKESAAPLVRRVAEVDGAIHGSLYVSAKKLGAPDEAIAGLSQMFAYDVDFQREIFGGDEFEALFEVYYDDKGRIARGGDILYGRLKWRGRQREKGYYLFTPDGAKRGDYFDASGESARRLLMKTPIDGARISSTFGNRKHPVLGYMKAHKGVDFAAARGTPIMAAGDGVIERAGPYGTFGNYVRIRHAQGYKTAYVHMNSIRKGIRTGVRVRQGDIIGYVGTTGRSTGPHLHYEVHYHDKAVNPQSLKIATGYKLSGKERTRFMAERDRIDAMRKSAGQEAELVAGKNASGGRAGGKSL